MGVLTAVISIAVLAVAVCSMPDEWTDRTAIWENTSENMSEHVLDRVPLIDGNNWLAENLRQNLNNLLNGFNFDSDLTKIPEWNCSSCNTDLPRMRKGKVGAQFWVAYSYCGVKDSAAVEHTLEQIDVIKRLTAKYPNDLQFADSAEGIEAAFSVNKIGSLIGVEGGHTIDSRLAVLRMYYASGVRYLSLAFWCTTPWAGMAGTTDGLTSFGRKVVLEMNRLGMMVDLTGASHQTRLDVISTSLAPVIFSHSNAAARCNYKFNVPDEVLRRVKENGGLVMVSFNTAQLRCDGTQAILDDVVAHINHIRNVAGVDHVGIGSYFDGSYDSSFGLGDVAIFPELFDRLTNNILVAPMWTDEEKKKLAGLNFLRVFRDVEKVRDELARKEILERQAEKGIRNKVKRADEEAAESSPVRL